jgi:hypothetical protein
MRLTTIVHHVMPFVAVGAGILVLIRPQLLNYVVAAYSIRRLKMTTTSCMAVVSRISMAISGA